MQKIAGISEAGQGPTVWRAQGVAGVCKTRMKCASVKQEPDRKGEMRAAAFGFA
jgi:hypothetical protein